MSEITLVASVDERKALDTMILSKENFNSTESPKNQLDASSWV